MVVLVVIGLDHLAERALADHFEDFVAVGQVVVGDVSVRALKTKRPSVIAPKLENDLQWPQKSCTK